MGQDDVLAAQLRQQIDQYKQQIDAQAQTEEQRQKNADYLASLNKTQQLERGRFAPENEVQAMLLTTWKLEQDLAEVEARIQKAFPQAEVTESIREELEPPAELETKKASGGIFSAMVQWVRKTFSANPKKVAAKARAQKLKDKEAAYAISTQELAQENAEIIRSINENGKPKVTSPMTNVDDDVEFWINTYKSQGWQFDGHDPVNEKGEVDDGLVYLAVNAFIREMGTPKAIQDTRRTNEEGKEVFSLNVGEFSLEDLHFLLSHRNPEGIERIIKPFREFNLADAVNKYALHTCKTVEEQQAKFLQMRYELHRLQGIAQWFPKFAAGVATPEQEAFVYKQFELFTVLDGWFVRLQDSGGGLYTAKQYYEEVLKDIPALEARQEAEHITNPIAKKANRQKYRYKLTDEEQLYLVNKYKLGSSAMIQGRIVVEDPPGSDMWRERDQDRDTDKLLKKRTEQWSMFSVEEFERYAEADLAMIQSAMEEINRFSLVDKNGRPRLLGFEGAEDLIEHGEEDLNYYEEMLRKGEALKFMMKRNPTFAKEHPEEKRAMEKKILQIFDLTGAVRAKLESPVGSSSRIRMYYDRNADPFWAERMQNEQMDSYDKTHK